MKSVRSKCEACITESDVKDFGHKIRRENNRIMAWILVVELITYVNNEEKTLLGQTVEKAKKNDFLKRNKEFMKRLNRGFSKNDIQYLKRLKMNIRP